MIRFVTLLALLAAWTFASNCQGKAEQPAVPPPAPAAAKPDAGAVLRPMTTGDPVLLEHVGPEATSLEIQLPPRFKLKITPLHGEHLPRATLKGPGVSVDVFMPEAGMGTLARAKQDLKTLYPTLEFDRSEEMPDGYFFIFHDTDQTTHKLEYYGRVDQKKLGVTCSSAALKSLPLAEQAISICLSLHDRNAK